MQGHKVSIKNLCLGNGHACKKDVSFFKQRTPAASLISRKWGLDATIYMKMPIYIYIYTVIFIFYIYPIAIRGVNYIDCLLIAYGHDMGLVHGMGIGSQ